MHTPNAFGKRALILWDGECGFCRRSVELILSLDRYGILEAMPYQDAPSPPMNPEIYRACDKAVHVITENGSVLRGAEAIFYALRFSKFAPLAFVFRTQPLLWISEVGYKVVASNRDFFSDLFFGKDAAVCSLPPTTRSKGQ